MIEDGILSICQLCNVANTSVKQVNHANKLFVLLTYGWKQPFNALISSGLCNYEVLIRHVITIMKTVFSNNWA